MNGFGDYLDEMMFKQSTDRDIERLFEGSIDPGDDLASVAGLVESLRAEGSQAPDEKTVGAFVQSASTVSASAARQRVVDGNATATAVGSGGMKRDSASVLLRRRVAAIAVAAALFVGGMSGMAVAANHAKPGDALYGLDRAFESVGVGSGGSAERLAEVQALFDAGDVPRGLQHAADAVKTHGREDSDASDALAEAADRVVSGGSEQSAATRASVAGLLSYLSKNAHDIDGRQVAELAREIGRSDDRPEAPPKASSPDSPGSSGSFGSSDHRPSNPPGRSNVKPGSPQPPSNRP
jgi:hypothetical protein